MFLSTGVVLIQKHCVHECWAVLDTERHETMGHHKRTCVKSYRQKRRVVQKAIRNQHKCGITAPCAARVDNKSIGSSGPSRPPLFGLR